MSSDVTWVTKCAAIVTDAWNLAPDSVQLVGTLGARYPNLNLSTAWGITSNDCPRLCGSITAPFSFPSFAASAGQWLLPWLALSAQLPYETSGPANDFMSFLLAVGSPALITYSVVLTILNRYRISKPFAPLISIAKESSKIPKQYPQLIHRLRDARYIVQESQQVPMRLLEGSGWLSSLVVLPENQRWWEATKGHLESTRRRVTLSLKAQIAFAAISWLFSVISAFSLLGDIDTGESIASGSIWLWMIPVISGWVAVGTKKKA